jgi:hypothetical protein
MKRNKIIKKNNKVNIQMIIIILLLTFGVTLILFSYSEKSNKEKVTCTYSQDIATQKMQFDFANTASGDKLSAPYTHAQADFILASKYANCERTSGTGGK